LPSPALTKLHKSKGWRPGRRLDVNGADLAILHTRIWE